MMIEQPSASPAPPQLSTPLSPYILVVERQLHPLRLHRFIHILSELTGGPVFLRQHAETQASTITVQLPTTAAPLDLLAQLAERFMGWRLSLQINDVANDYGDRVQAFTCPECGAWALHREQHRTLGLRSGYDNDDVEDVELAGWIERCGSETCDFAACEPLTL